MELAIAVSRVAACEATHTTIYIAAKALERGHIVHFVEPWDFEIESAARVVMRAHTFDQPVEDHASLVRSLSERSTNRRYVRMPQIHALLLRTNPINPGVLVFAHLAARQGIIVHNDPRSLVLTGHKGYLASLQDLPRPSTLVTRSRATALLFASECRDGAVIKPARSSGGRGVSLVLETSHRARMEAAFNLARALGDGYVVIQEYLPEAVEGEKRLVWLNGALIGGYLRKRAPGEFRHNLTRGGRPRACELQPTDHAIARAITPHLLRDKVWLAGLDIIGGRIVEVNTLNPGGIHFGDSLGGTKMAERIIETLEGELLEQQLQRRD